MMAKTWLDLKTSDSKNFAGGILSGYTILLVVSGGIAAYKSLELARLLKKNGARVLGVITKGGLEFITPLSLAALIEDKVYSDLFSLTDEQEMGHIRLARIADAIMVAPASANFIERIAQGRADDLAATILLATTAPIFIAPAMNPTMFAHSATQKHIVDLQQRGMMVIDPHVGDTACGEDGKGRLPEAGELFSILVNYFKTGGKLSGKNFLLTCGATREKLDRVRYISNFSSGKQGAELAKTLSKYGAEVVMVAGVMDEKILKTLKGIRVIHAETAIEMARSVLAEIELKQYDGFMGVAAVGDFRAKQMTDGKLNKQALSQDGDVVLPLTMNPDILAQVAQHKHRPHLVVGFFAEVDVKNAATAKKIAEKYHAKNCDLLLVNEIGEDGAPFNQDDTNIIFYDGDKKTDWGYLQKKEVAKLLAEVIVEKLK
ncbi:MAG: bifunctional phosphopantothenoylcysteine decarboxylase/phosphopantothenate--cysteine ligase CoaBC [Alphaproteobacteria bacterium]